MARIFAARRVDVAVVVAAAGLPRLTVLLYERGSILTAYVEKSDQFARTFVESGTYGFVPGIPSAWTQPLYGWFLIPLYWILGRRWEVVGGAQIIVAVTTAVIVLGIGTRWLGRRAGVIAGVVATLNPYLVWHDVHVNREIVDQVLAAALFALTLVAWKRFGLVAAATVGAIAGLAILGNSRLIVLPFVLAAFIAWGRWRRAAPAIGVLLAATALVLAPWVVRNKIQVGCFAVTTDGRALWKANNANTYRTLAAGKWIDDVPPLAGAPKITPEFEVGYWVGQHRKVHVDECAQMRLYEHATIRYWEHHPGGKLQLMVQATRMLWQPQQTRTEGGPTDGGVLRAWVEAGWAIPIYLLAAIGLFLVPRRFAALALVFLGYETLEAWVFAGATRYRITFDFVLALLAAATLDRLLHDRVPLLRGFRPPSEPSSASPPFGGEAPRRADGDSTR